MRGAIAALALIGIVGCAGVEATEPLPRDISIYTVRAIDGKAIAPELSVNFYIVNDPALVRRVWWWNECGTATTVRADREISRSVDITDEQLVVHGVDSHLDERKCDGERFAISQQIVNVVGASPRYTFDGTTLELRGADARVTFTLVKHAKATTN